MSSNPSTLKQRHYAALSSRLKNLQANLAESEIQLDMMAQHLGYMNRLGVACGSQFMAVSRLLDVEIAQANEQAYDQVSQPLQAQVQDQAQDQFQAQVRDQSDPSTPTQASTQHQSQ